MKKCCKCKLNKDYSEFNKDKYQKDGYQNKCKDCKSFYYNKNKQKYIDNYIENRESLLEYQNNYYKENNIARIDYQIQYDKHRKLTDSLYKLKCTLRSRINKAFKNKNYIKGKTLELLGTDLQTAKLYLQNKFSDGMTWENHGKWHIDHIIPLSSANTEEELIKLCHYTNLQPLWAVDNLKKGDRKKKKKSLL